MLGLKRQTVKLVPYSSEWRIEFQKSHNELISLLKGIDLQIEHIGSTSIVDMLAKPILDIGIGAKSNADIIETINLLSKNGYIERGDRKDRGGYLMAKDIEPEVVSHHIHIHQTKDNQWKNYLIFRNALRANRLLSMKYKNLKIKLLKVHNGNREKYTNGKNDFINKVLTENGSTFS